MNIFQSIGLLFILSSLAIINGMISHYGVEEIKGLQELLLAIGVFTAGSILFSVGAE